MRHHFRRDGARIEERPRQAKFGWRAAAHDRDLAKKLREHDILATENIMLAGLAVPHGGEMPVCDIIDMDEIEAGVHKTGDCQDFRVKAGFVTPT